MFHPTVLIYSSHNRCEYLHRNWIIERALNSHNNKTILYLPMSMPDYRDQDYSWSTFDWYFNHFRQWGLHAIPFYWRDDMRREDVDLLFHYLATYEVVILGGGQTSCGLHRYKELGRRYYGDFDAFNRVLQHRQNQGKLTVGFSAGATQLCQFLAESAVMQVPDHYGFALARNVLVTLHHEWGQEYYVKRSAECFPNCMTFGLPNDAGLSIDQGYLPSGNIWQIIEFIIDCSWDAPEDSFHIKTRQGMKIDHFYHDGRHWAFNGGDKMVRVMSPDNNYQEAWIVRGGQITDYRLQEPSIFQSIDHILSTH